MLLLSLCRESEGTVCSRLNVYLKQTLVDPALIGTQRLFGGRRLLNRCIFIIFDSVKFFSLRYLKLTNLWQNIAKT